MKDWRLLSVLLLLLPPHPCNVAEDGTGVSKAYSISETEMNIVVQEVLFKELFYVW